MRKRVAALTGVLVLLALAVAGGSAGVGGPAGSSFGIAHAIAVQEREDARLLALAGVVGTGVGVTSGGTPVIKIFTESAGVQGIPARLDDVATDVEVTGRVYARGTTTDRYRPAPPGVSVGHPSITAGTIGARVLDGSGGGYIPSNNHVLAAANDAAIGDP